MDTVTMVNMLVMDSYDLLYELALYPDAKSSLRSLMRLFDRVLRDSSEDMFLDLEQELRHVLENPFSPKISEMSKKMLEVLDGRRSRAMLFRPLDKAALVSLGRTDLAELIVALRGLFASSVGQGVLAYTIGDARLVFQVRGAPHPGEEARVLQRIRTAFNALYERTRNFAVMKMNEESESSPFYPLYERLDQMRTTALRRPSEEERYETAMQLPEVFPRGEREPYTAQYTNVLALAALAQAALFLGVTPSRRLAPDDAVPKGQLASFTLEKQSTGTYAHCSACFYVFPVTPEDFVLDSILTCRNCGAREGKRL